MDGLEFSSQLQQWANDVLVWVGFGTLTGLLAKAIMPGRDPGGPVATVAMGICGAIIGCGAYSFFFLDGQRVTPISPMGFFLATAGAFLILAFFRVLAGYWLDEGNVPLAQRRRRSHTPRRRRRRTVSADLDDYDY
jgi:uncharacterized membrane protein YeaQ/YmgE (transglycosylase-associated protein family)